MWYIIIPLFIAIDPNMYSMYYYGIKRPHPLDYGRNERYPSDTTHVELVQTVEELEWT